VGSKVSARITAIEAIEESRKSSTQLISSDAWEKLVNIAWDNQSAPGDRRRIRAELVSVLDAEAQAVEETGEDN